MRYLLIYLLIIVSFTGHAQTVYKTPSGSKYHLTDCRMVKNVSQRLSLPNAAKQGLQPCKICKPAFAYGNSVSKKAQGKASTQQCKGYTKNRTRCKHMTSIGNGYCFQHQP